MTQPYKGYSSKNLPGGLAQLNRKRCRKAIANTQRLPKWVRDKSEEGEASRQRIQLTFDLWVNHTPIPEIMAKIGVSTSTVYDYLKKARVMRADLMASDINDILMEAIASRHQIIQDIRKTIRDMRNLGLVPASTLERLTASSAAGFNGNSHHDNDDALPEGWVLVGVTPEVARVELEAYRLIGEQEKAIEELLGLRGKNAAAAAPRESAPAMTGNIYLIDASIRPGEEILGNRMTVIPANDPRLDYLKELDEEEDDA